MTNPATRIVLIAAGMLAATSLIVGAAVLAVMQNRLGSAIGGLLVVAVCGLLVAGGAVLMRWQLQPVSLRLAKAEEEASRARDWLQKIADNVPALVGYVDAGQRYRFANRIYDDWFGMNSTQMPGKTMRELWDAERYEGARPRIEKALAGELVDFDDQTAGPAGTRTLHTTFVPDPGPGGRALGFFILSSDITKATEARMALDNALQRLELALDATRVTVWETDLRSGETVLSDAWAEMLERPPGKTRSTAAELSALVHPQEMAELNRLSKEAVRGMREAFAVEYRVRASSGQWKWILSRGQIVERDAANGRALRMMGTNLDITERKRNEVELEKLAHYDSLTGAANRALFRERIGTAVARNRRSARRAVLMYLDIDDFKAVNDRLGQAAGDVLLKEFAARLAACVRGTDTVGRLGGDDFAVLLEDVSDAGTATRVAEKILESMRAPVSAEGHRLVITTSIGIVEFGAIAKEEIEALAKRADAALEAARAAGRNTYRVAG